MHGQLVTGRESIPLDDVDPGDFAPSHVQNLVVATMGHRRVGVVEQIAIDPHRPAGLTGPLDGHRANDEAVG